MKIKETDIKTTISTIVYVFGEVMLTFSLISFGNFKNTIYYIIYMSRLTNPPEEGLLLKSQNFVVM